MCYTIAFKGIVLSPHRIGCVVFKSDLTFKIGVFFAILQVTARVTLRRIKTYRYSFTQPKHKIFSNFF